MARPRNTDLDAFKAYLRQHSGCQEASIHTYSANVRRVLRIVYPLTTESLTSFLYTECASSSRGNMRKSWNHYCDFRKLEGEELPTMLTMGKVQRESVLGTDTFTPRGDLATALTRLNQRYRVPATALSAARWKDISPAAAVPASLPLAEGPYALLHISALQQSFIFPALLISVLAKWADPNKSQPLMDQPLVPSVEGGTVSVSAVQLQHFLLRAARSVQIESADGPRFDLQALMRTPEEPPVAGPTISEGEKRERLLEAARKAEQDPDPEEEFEVLGTEDIARRLL